MVYRVLADAVVAVHFAFLVFVVTGPLLARRRPAVTVFHLPALAWAVGILTVGYECPLTALENALRRRAGQPVYPGGFIDHYVENVLYPQRYTPLVLALAAVTIALGYAGLLRSGYRRFQLLRGSRVSTPQSSAAASRARKTSSRTRNPMPRRSSGPDHRTSGGDAVLR